MVRNGGAGGTVVTSEEHAEGHEAMDEEQISDEGITRTFVVDTGHVRVHRSVVKQTMSGEEVTEDTCMRRIDTYGLVSHTNAKTVVWWYFRKYDIKKIKEKYTVNDILKLDHHVLSMISYLDYFVTCSTVVFSRRTSGRCSEGIFESGHHDSSSLHP
jgi:hypothetical protein